MLRKDGEMFILIPDASNKAVLHPGKVICADDATFEALCADPIAAPVGSDINTYATVNGKFMQQGAKVLEWQQTEAGHICRGARVGPVVSAEKRQIYRVSTVTAGIVALVGREANCPVVDVSPEGFAAILSTPLQIGTQVSITLRYKNASVQTVARVQTAKNFPKGKVRYGFLVPDKHGSGRKLLLHISGEIQRAQLRRLAGAAK